MKTVNPAMHAIDAMSASKGAAIIGESAHQSSGPGPSVMAASSLEGDNVMSRDGDDVGNIKEIMIDVASGRIAYAVMSSGGFLGIGNKLMALPWSALTLDSDHKCFVIDATSDEIRQAPGFDKDSWPSMVDPMWASSVYQYYGREPYWHDEGGMMGNIENTYSGPSVESDASPLMPGSFERERE